MSLEKKLEVVRGRVNLKVGSVMVVDWIESIWSDDLRIKRLRVHT